MDALEALLSRNSAPKLTEPAPSGDALQKIFQAALRAPDHARLAPWRNLVIEGAARDRLGALFVQVAAAADGTLDDEALAKIRAKPLRAPLIIVVAVRLQVHPKVPEIEQYLSAGAAAHAMLLAAHAQGFAGIWRTGDMAFNRAFMTVLGLADNEHIVGFLYLGTPEGRAKPLPQYCTEDYFEFW